MRKIKLLAEDFIKIENELWMICKDFNVIFSIDLDTKVIRLRDSIPGRDLMKARLGAKITLIKNELCFLPMENNIIWRYNINGKTWSALNVQKARLNNYEFFQAIQANDNLFLIGYYPAIVCYDLKNNSFSYSDEVYKDANLDNTFGCFRCDYIVNGAFFYMASCRSNSVLKYDTVSKKYEWISVGEKNNAYSGLSYDGSYFYLSPRNDTHIVIWDGKGNTKEYELPLEFKGSRLSFLGAVDMKDSVFMPGFKSKKSVMFHKSTGKIEVEDGQYTFYKQYDEELKIYQKSDGGITICDNNRKNLWSVESIIDAELLYDYFCGKELFFSNRFEQLTSETRGASLDMFMVYNQKKLV